MEIYKGTIVEESLVDNRILNDFKIINVKITKEENTHERWHLYEVEVTEDKIQNLSKFLEPHKMVCLFLEQK